jgi:molybdopterin-guanine dinucleotide biosynthesis protein B
VAATRVISVIGKKNAGKTTLVVALVQEYVRRGRRVGTIKHGDHPAVVDREGRAVKTMIESPGERVLFERTTEAANPLALVRAHFLDMDIVVLEGFRRHPLPKIEVHRRSEHSTPLFDLARTEPGDWVAMVTDDRSLRLPFPVFNFTDTAWFTTLAHLAWERALVVEG